MAYLADRHTLQGIKEFHGAAFEVAKKPKATPVYHDTPPKGEHGLHLQRYDTKRRKDILLSSVGFPPPTKGGVEVSSHPKSATMKGHEVQGI